MIATQNINSTYECPTELASVPFDHQPAINLKHKFVVYWKKKKKGEKKGLYRAGNESEEKESLVTQAQLGHRRSKGRNFGGTHFSMKGVILNNGFGSIV